MIVTVKLFAAARDLVGHESIEVTLTDGHSIADLRSAIADQYPDLKSILRHTLFAINTDYAADAIKIPNGAEVACIPPVSGG